MKATKLLTAALFFTYFCHAEIIQLPPSFFPSVATNEVSEANLVSTPPDSGTFFSLQITNQPPLPYNPAPGVDVYSFGNVFIVDDREVDYVALREEQLSLRSFSMMATESESGPPSPGEGSGEGEGGTNDIAPAYNYFSGELWLEATDVTNSVLVTLHNTEEAQTYNILVKTNLGQSSWATEQTLIGPAGTNAFSYLVAKNGRSSLFLMIGAPQMTRVETPFFDPTPGNYVSEQTVRFFESTAGATIHYTTNGSVPTTNDTVIASGASLTVSSTTQFKAKAWKNEMLPSSVGTGGYTFYLAAPSFNPSGGIYSTGQTVTIYGTPSGSTIRYTTNGSDPTSSSPEITDNDSITLTTNITLKAKTFKGGSESGISSQVYQVRFPPANDNIANAQVISNSSGTVHGSSIGATLEDSENYCTFFPEYSQSSSVWYQWTASTNGVVTFSTTGDYETEIDIYTGTNWDSCGDNLTTITNAFAAGSWGRTYTTIPVQSGINYKIAVTVPFWVYSLGNFALDWTMQAQVALPSFSPEGGTYNTNQSVTIGTSTPNAIIHYTLNGIDPTESDPVIRSGDEIEISSSYALKAKAWKDGLEPSVVKSNFYTIDTNATNLTLVVSKPQFSPFTTNFASNIVVTVTCATSGSEIHYTTDGSEPMTNDTLITSGGTFTLTNTAVFKAKAWKTGSNSSSVQSAIYAKNGEDTDFDGIPDEWELAHGSDLFSSDASLASNESFAHGLSNLQVFNNPSVLINDNYSTANDDIPDWWKVKNGISINDPAGAQARGNNGMTMAQSYQGGFTPSNASQHPGTLPKVNFRIVRGPENRVYMKVDTILANVTKYQLYFYVWQSFATNLPESFANNQINMVEFTPSIENPDNIFQIPNELIFGDYTVYQFFLKAIDQDAHESEIDFNDYSGSQQLIYWHDFTDARIASYIPLVEEQLKWQMRFYLINEPLTNSDISYSRTPYEYQLYDEEINDEPLFRDPVNPTWVNIGDYSSLHGVGMAHDINSYGIFLYDWGLEYSNAPVQPYLILVPHTTNYYGLEFLGYQLTFADGSSNIVTEATPCDISVKGDSYWVHDNVEQPTFNPIAYYFGASRSSSFDAGQPPSPELPSADTKGQTNPVLVVSLRASLYLDAWSKVEIYRPGSSTPVSGRYGYIQQYWDKAYLCGTNGDVPRTGEDNVGGKKKINTATAVQTGLLSPLGQFTPTKPGKVILTTKPDTNGFYGECAVYVIDIQVDANHDGQMDNFDFTSEDRPFTFWVNNDIDRGHIVDGDDHEEDDLQITDPSLTPRQAVPDFGYRSAGWNPGIPSDRDLEDYARLWLPGVSNLISSLPSGYLVEVSWRNPDAPGINIFTPLDASGGIGYLTNESVNSQLSSYVGSASSFQKIVLSQKFAEFTSTPLGDYYIFCGSARGRGELLVQVKDQTGAVIGETSAFIRMKDIKEMYERYTVGDEGDSAPYSVAVTAQDFLPQGVSSYRYNHDQPDEPNEPYILHVHGWNMETWEKDRFAETAYKRLYWQGYQGRFGSFRWPTKTGALTFDDSELNAWKSGAPLHKLLEKLNNQYPGNVRVTAHSMGNVVVSEALRTNAPFVHTYIAMQGAIASHTYDPTTTNRTFGILDSGTPDRHAEYWTNGATCYFNGASGAAKYINCFNERDWALTTLWRPNEDVKPDTGYSYGSGNYFREISEEIFFPEDTYDIFSHIIEARCEALGSEINVGGSFSISDQIDLDSSPYSFGDLHKGHSGQFRSTNMKRGNFWHMLADKTRVLPQ